MADKLGVALACAINDADGHLADALEATRSRLESQFDRLSLRITDKTHPRTVAALRSLGATMTLAAQQLETVGRERRTALAGAVEDGVHRIVTGDLDHVLRWAHAAPGELRAALERAERTDCLVIGRPARALDQAPMPLRETERLVNRAYERLTGDAWDLLSSLRVLSPPAAATIVERSTVDTIATDVDWPLLCARVGLRLDYLEAPHLTYQPGTRLTPDPVDPSDPGHARSWLLRLRICGWMADAMAAYAGADVGGPGG